MARLSPSCKNRPLRVAENPAMLDLGIENVITYNPLAISERATIEEALNSMDEFHFHHLPVVDEQRRLVGIVSDLDLRRASNTASTRVGEVMTPAPTTVSHQSPPTEALRIMLEGRFHSVPVLKDRRLIGIITSSDFLREFSYGAAGSNEPVSQYMLGDEHHVESEASVREAAAAMDELACDYLAVLKGPCPVGVVSRRTVSVWTEFSQATNPTQTRASQLAMTDVPTLLPSDTLQEAAKLMLDRGVAAVLVADRAHRFVGLLTSRELLSAMLDRMNAA